MKLENINKSIYRKNLNIVIVCFIVSFLLLALLFGSVLISLFSPNVDLAEHTSNFQYNLTGVIIALLICAAGLNHLKRKPFFKEIYYVWQLKQLHNLIYRRLKKIRLAASQDDINAIITLKFYFDTLKQVYELDDNTITLSKVNKEIETINEIVANKNLSISAEQFNKYMLASYK